MTSVHAADARSRRGCNGVSTRHHLVQPAGCDARRLCPSPKKIPPCDLLSIRSSEPYPITGTHVPPGDGAENQRKSALQQPHLSVLQPSLALRWNMHSACACACVCLQASLIETKLARPCSDFLRKWQCASESAYRLVKRFNRAFALRPTLSVRYATSLMGCEESSWLHEEGFCWLYLLDNPREKPSVSCYLAQALSPRGPLALLRCETAQFRGSWLNASRKYLRQFTTSSVDRA